MYMGIDPGIEGAIVVRKQDGELLPWHLKNVDYEIFAGICREHSVQHIFLEKAQVMIKQGYRPGLKGVFTYGRGFGRLEGWIEAVSIPMTMFAPIAWTRELHKGVVATHPKDKSQITFKRLFPKIKNWVSPRSKSGKLDEGFVDAALILEFGRRHIGEKIEDEEDLYVPEDEKMEYEY